MNRFIYIGNKLLAVANNLTQLDTRYFLKGGFWALFQQILGVSSGLLVSYLFGHFTSKTIFGEYNLVLSFLGMLTFLSLPGIDLALTRSVAMGFDASLIKGYQSKLKHSLLGFPILLFIALFYLYSGKLNIGLSVLICCFLFPILYSYTLYPAFLTAKKKFKDLALISSGSSLFFLIVVGTAILILPISPVLILAYLIATIIPAILGYWYTQKLVPKKSKSDDTLIKYGSFLTILSVLPWIAGNLNSVLLATVLGVETLAIYAVASRFLTAVQKNFQAFYKPITVKLAIQTNTEHIRTLKQHTLKLISIGIVLAALLWISTPFLINFFFTEEYSQAIIYGQLLSLSLIPLPFSWVVSDMLIYQKNKLPQVITTIIPSFIKIVLYFIVIPLWKIEGLIILVLIERYTEWIIPLYFLVKNK